MKRDETTITFRERDFKGSRLRCLLLTSNSPAKVAEFLTSMVAPHAVVTTRDHWAPRGFLKPDEARLGETAGFLSGVDRTTMANWWLAQQGGANTPNWDLVSTCHINDRPGLVLVEAKAHEGELSDDVRRLMSERVALLALRKRVAEESASSSGTGLKRTHQPV